MTLPKTRSLEPYHCPECDKDRMEIKCARRERCSVCAAERHRGQMNESKRRSREQVRAEKQAAKAILEAQKAQERRKANAERFITHTPERLAALTTTEAQAIQAKQCQKCDFWSREGAPGNHSCAYYLRKGIGHRRDPGDGPGKCRSFAPKGKRSAEDLKKLRLQRFAEMEATEMGSSLGPGGWSK